ncbi:hypothetical protein PENTCL1PPCAC_21745, partial [Pristionchus entomophagus]
SSPLSDPCMARLPGWKRRAGQAPQLGGRKRRSIASGGGTMESPHPLANTSKYKQYVIAVDKALKSFENTNEWADLISALGKLAKVFSQHAKFGDIPKAVTVAKRLSQCLHPALPMGVHLKALETYKQIFDILGREALPKQLYLFAVGLFPLMDHCGIKVKGELLSIFEQYLLPLGENLRPSLPGFLAGVLLGLEEGTEFYDRSFNLLDRVCEAVGASSFYACLWHTVLGSPSVRLPALIYVNAKFDKTRSIDEQSWIIGDNVHHMVSALCAAGEDTGSPLVQRNLLDLLCAAFPLDSTTVTRADFVELLRRTLFVVLRRDMSLNRRLYTWILNPSGVGTMVNSVPVGDDLLDTSFFTHTVLPMIVDALKGFLEGDTVEIPVSMSSTFFSPTSASKDADTQQFVEVRTVRMLTYLQDRPEVGRAVVMRVLPMLLKKCARLMPECEKKEGMRDRDMDMDSSPPGRLSLMLQLPSALCSSSYLPEYGESKEEDEERKIRRREEMAKNLNVLMSAMDEVYGPGFLWKYLADYYEWLLTSLNGVSGGEKIGLLVGVPSMGGVEAEEEMMAYANVVTYALSLSQSGSTASGRSKHLPELLRRILICANSMNVIEKRDRMVLSTVDMAAGLLTEISRAGGSIETQQPSNEAAAVAATPQSPNKAFLASLVDKQEQEMMEACLEECLRLMTTICRYYCSHRALSRWPLLRAMNELLLQFADFPLYCAGWSLFASPSRMSLPEWMDAIVKVIDVDSWLVQLQQRGREREYYDFEPRAAALEIVTRLSMRSAAVIAQHAAVESRTRPMGGCSSSQMTVLLKPLLHKGHLLTMDESGLFDKCGAAAWASCGNEWPMHHATSARLVLLLHSRNASEPSSVVENIMMKTLTTDDSVLATEAARTFHRIWTLTRSDEEGMLAESAHPKPFNRVLMFLLGVLADDSLSAEKVELKGVATTWFVDCARRNDLPTIIQMLAVMLMNPATARISIQYVKQEAKVTRSECSAVPTDVQSIMLLAADKRQRLHHLMNEAEQEDGDWMCDLRSKLLASSSKESTKTDLFPAAPTQNDVPNFDEEETDSLDTLSLSMEGHDPVVVETLQWIIDCVVDEEESELDTQRKFNEAMNKRSAPNSANILPDVVPDSARSDTSVVTANGMTEKEMARVARESVADAPPFPPSVIASPSVTHDGVTRIRRGHKRQDSLAETIFCMNSGDLRLFDLSDVLKQPTQKTDQTGTVTSCSSAESGVNGHMRTNSGEGITMRNLYHDLHAHMLLYSESGRVVDLGRAETAFRILLALLRPRGAPVPSSILLNCLVSSMAATAPMPTPFLAFAAGNADGTAPESITLPDLMSRHVRAILGRTFWGNDDGTDPAAGGVASKAAQAVVDESRTRNLTQLELIMTISLHFLRSFFVNSPIAPVSKNDLIMSWKCKIAILDLLAEIMRELSTMMMTQQSKAFVTFIQTMLSRAKMQKCLLLLLVSSVHDPRKTEKSDEMHLSMLIAEYNEGIRMTPKGLRRDGRLAGLVGAYNRSLLALTAATIRLEFEIKHGFNSYTDQIPRSRFSSPSSLLGNASLAFLGGSTGGNTTNRTGLRELPSSLVELRVFLLTVLNALKKCPERHEGWLQLVVHILPWLDRALPKLCMRMSEQLCKNIETAIGVAYGKTSAYARKRNEETSRQSIDEGTPSPDSEVACGTMLGTEFPANFIVMTMEALTTVLHFCLIDTSQQQQAAGAADATPPAASSNAAAAGGAGGGTAPGVNSSPNSHSWAVGSALAAVPGTRGATELFTNLVKVFSFGESNSNVPLKLEQRSMGSAWKQARSELLVGLPHFLATICDVWSVVKEGAQPVKPVGTPQQLGRLVLDLLSPLVQFHQQHLLSSLALVWLTRGDVREKDMDRPSFKYTSAQLDMTSLLLDSKVILFETLITAISESLRETGSKSGGGGKPGMSSIDKPSLFPTDTPLLELLHGCVQTQSEQQLIAAWPYLHALMMDAPLSSLPSRSVFLLFSILCDFVRVCTPCVAPIEERMKIVIKQVQEVTQRLVEACNGIVAWQLEQPTWLKRTLVVKHDNAMIGGFRSTDTTPSLESTPLPSLASADPSQRASTVSLTSNKPQSAGDNQSAQFSLKSSASNLRSSMKQDGNNNKQRDPAESTRALFLLAEHLTELIDCVCRSDEKERLMPVLHAVWNNVVPYLRAKNARNSRFFLASSQLLASMSSYNYMRPVWRKTTMDLLLDSTFFKMDMHSLRQWLVVVDHLMTHDKSSFKDLLKSISYAPSASFTNIMTSRETEYEARAQSLKRLAFVLLGSELDQYKAQLPDVQERLAENLRLCQAVPSIRAAVFLCYRVLLLRLNASSLVSMWPAMVTELVHVLLQVEQQLAGATDGSDDLASSKDDQWMQLYLAGCKLLESLCTLPAGYLAQFQMCHWAFVSSVPSTGTAVFVPFAGRIHKLLQVKYGKLSRDEISTATASLSNMKHLTGFDELRPFFYTLSRAAHAQGDQGESLRDSSILSGSLSYKSAINRLEHALYVDFAEHWQL